jgi:hypothetical protein
MVPTPVPLENFEEIPVIREGPYEYGYLPTEASLSIEQSSEPESAR